MSRTTGPVRDQLCLRWECEYTSSSYAIGAGPQMIVLLDLPTLEWTIEWMEYDQELGDWSGWVLNGREAAGVLAAWLPGGDVPGSAESIERMAAKLEEDARAWGDRRGLSQPTAAAGELASEALARGGMAAFNEARGCDLARPPVPCNHHYPPGECPYCDSTWADCDQG